MPPKVALEHLRKLIQLHAGETRTCKEELEEQKAYNHSLIKQLRKDIMAKRIAALCPGKNEILLRKALAGHHDGSKIFEEKEPRDINENVDFQTSDLKNKLNAVKHDLQTKQNQLNSMLVVFNDTVEDVAFLELEGPVGDKRCLALENHIQDVGKRILEAEILQHTLKHVRDQLAVEQLTNHTSLDTVEKLLKDSQEELAVTQHSLGDAQSRKTHAVANTIRTEVDNHSQRKHRTRRMTHYRKLAEEQKHEFMHLRKTIQAYFMYQESVPLRHAMSDQHREGSQDFDNCFLLGELQNMEMDTNLLREVTGSHDIQGVVQCFETQRDTFQHLQSLVKEMEVKKVQLLQRMEQLSVERNAAVFHDQAAEDGALHRADEQRRARDAAAASTGWSALAAANRVTQALARLRQLLEYLVSSLARASLVPAPPRTVCRLETAAYLTEMLRLAGVGVSQLMERLDGQEPDEVLQRSARAKFALTRSEEKFSTRQPPTLGLAQASDDGDTTGDDAQMATRAVMKRQAQLIVQAKLKAGFGKKKW